jgi:P27 family predicted phage terminase small subunit
MQLVKGKKGRAPEHLSAEAGAFWSDIVLDYDITDQYGQMLLLQACEALDLIRECQAIIGEDGKKILDRFGAPKAHPLLTVERDARSQFSMFLNRLELEPEPEAPKKRRTR